MSLAIEKLTPRVWQLVCIGILAVALVSSSAISLAQEQVRKVELDEAPIAADDDQDEDDADFEEAAQVMNPFGIEQNKMVAAKRFQLAQLFAVEVEELQRVCDLDKKQTLKLRIATKGAVKKMTAEWVKQTNGQFGGMRVAQPNGDKQKKQPEEIVIKDADEIDDMTLQMVMMNGMGNPFKFEDPRDGRFWKKTVSSVLSAEQSAKFKQYRLDRAALKRKGLIDSAVSSLTVELGLTDDQVPKFDAIVRPPMDEATINCFTFYEPYVLYYHASKADKNKLKKLLSPAQLQKWKIFVAPSKQIGQMMEMENGDIGMVVEDVDFWVGLGNAVEDVFEGVAELFSAFAKQE